MKTWVRIVLGVVLLIALAAGSAAAYVSVKWDESYDHIAGPDLKVSTDSAVIARGEYLVRGPAHCANCHLGGFQEAPRVDSGHAVPMQGGVRFISGPVATIYAPNLTPDSSTGIGRYTDRQLFRMLRHAIKPDGQATIWPLMPFFMMADEDLVAIVSYLRAQPAVRNEVPKPTWSAMGKAIRTVVPAFKPQLDHVAPATAPAEAPTRERGEYIARYVANCVGCHTQYDMRTGEKIGQDFAGGSMFTPEPGFPGHGDGLSFRSVNLTRDPTGVLVKIGSKENWIKRFRAGRIYKGSPMPWGPFSRMSDADLEALWVYLNALPPVPNNVSPSVFRDSTAMAR